MSVTNMPWRHNRKLRILFGVGDDAAYLAAHIAARARGSTRTLVRKCSAL